MLKNYRALGWVGALLMLALASFTPGGPPLTRLAHPAFTPPPALAAQASPPPALMEPLALQILKSMSDTLKRSTSFTFMAVTIRDVPAITGQSLEFYARNSVAVTRPNKLLVHHQGDIVDGSIWYDGQRLSLLDSLTKFYARVTAPATIDGVLDLLENKFHEPLPVAAVLYADPYARLTKGLKTAFVVGDTSVDGVRAHHLAFTEAQADWQIWVQDTPRPVPTRLVVNYKNVPRIGSLRVAVDFANWNLNAQLPAASYLFVIPPGGKQIPIKAR